MSVALPAQASQTALPVLPVLPYASGGRRREPVPTILRLGALAGILALALSFLAFFCDLKLSDAPRLKMWLDLGIPVIQGLLIGVGLTLISVGAAQGRRHPFQILALSLNFVAMFAIVHGVKLTVDEAYGSSDRGFVRWTSIRCSM